MRLRIISLFFCALLGVVCMAATAQPASAFAVSPVIVDLEIDPGTASQGRVQISNTDQKAQTFYVTIQNFVAKGEGGAQDFLPATDVRDLAAWMTPQSGSVRLGPGESREFSYSIHVPQDAEPGGHYAALFFSTLPSNSEQGSSVGVGAKTGILFLVRVPGDIQEDARIESFRVSSEWTDRLPVSFELRIRNLGNVHFKPAGTIVIKNLFGQEVATIPLNPRSSSVLPNSVRRIDTTWMRSAEGAHGGFFRALTLEWNNFGLGRYTAAVEGSYGARRTTLSATVSFWVIPWRMLIVGVLILLILVFGLKAYRRLIVRRTTERIRSQL